MADIRRDRTGDLVESTPRPSGDCAACTSADPQVRAAHHLSLAKHGGLDELKPHLYQHFAQTKPPDERREAIDSLCQWVANLMYQWSGFADEATGAPLPWWEARRQMAGRRGAIAEAAHARAPAAHQARQGNLGPLLEPLLSQERLSTTAPPAQQRRAPREEDYLGEPEEYTAEPEHVDE